MPTAMGDKQPSLQGLSQDEVAIAIQQHSNNNNNDNSESNKHKKVQSTLKSSFGYTKKDLANLNPDATEFKIVVQWHQAGIEIDREEIDARRAAAKTLEKEAQEVFADTFDGARAAELQKEAEAAHQSYREELSKYNKAAHAAQVAQMAYDLNVGGAKYEMAGQWKSICDAAKSVAKNYNPKPKPISIPPRINTKTKSSSSSKVQNPSTKSSTIDLTLTNDDDNSAAGDTDMADGGTMETTNNDSEKLKPIMVKARDGTEVELDSILDKPKLHKCGETSKSTKRKGSYSGKVLKASKQGDSEAKRQKYIIPEEKFNEVLGQPYGPRKNSKGDVCQGDDKRDHFLKWRDGVVRCGVCPHACLTLKNLIQHICGTTHIIGVAKEKAKREKQKSLIPQLHAAMRQEKLVGQSFSGELKVYQMETLEEMCKVSIMVGVFYLYYFVILESYHTVPCSCSLHLNLTGKSNRTQFWSDGTLH